MIGKKLNNIESIDTNNLHQPEPLSKRVVRGGIWVFALRITNRGLGFIRTIMLARLLAPHDFGLTGEQKLAFEVKLIPNARLSQPSGLKAFGKTYSDFEEVIVTHDLFASDNELFFLPGWMI